MSAEQQNWDEVFDVIVVGSGAAGLANALTASVLGLQPVVLEKAEKLGGGTSFANGGLWIGNNHLARAAGYVDSREAVLAYMRFIAGDQAIEDNLLAYVDRGPEALKFFEDCGLQFRISKGLSDHYYDFSSWLGRRRSVPQHRFHRRDRPRRMAGHDPDPSRHTT